MNVTVGNRIVVVGERVDRPPRTGSTEGRSKERNELTDFGDGSELCRSVNERIRDLEGIKLEAYDFVCECEDHACTRVMRMTAKEYETLRSDDRQFAVLPGHEHPAHEKVVVRTDRYAVVRKRRMRGRRTRNNEGLGSNRRQPDRASPMPEGRVND
jgi:hypothetical protein